MKVLVTGGAGYIGSHVVAELLDNNHDVTVFDNLSSGLRENLFSEARFVIGDILDETATQNLIGEGFDAIFHFAALKAAGDSMVSPQKYSKNNITGTLNILNAASCTKCRNIVFSSTAAVYGEPHYLPIDEAHPTNPENFYGFTKLEIERFLEWYKKLFKMNHAVLRYFNAAGYDPQLRVGGLEKNPQNLIPSVMEVACGRREFLSIFGNDYPTSDGTGVRDYIHVNDLAVAHVKALDYIVSNNTCITINLGSESGHSVQAVVDTARAVTSHPIPTKIMPRREGDVASVSASSRKATELLGWSPRLSDLHSLIATTWKAYCSHI